MTKIDSYLGRAHLVGITGLPSSGKSGLIDRLTQVARSKGLSVGIIAVDATSPFTGGSLLGDRIRMQQHYLDPEVSFAVWPLGPVADHFPKQLVQ